MTRVAILGCGSQKLDLSGDKGPVFIGRLYTSTYFTLKRQYAKACCDRYYVLSAKHGLVPQDYAVTESYDLTIDDLSDDELAAWADEIAGHLDWFDADTTVEVLAGQDYIEPLREHLDACAATVEYPFADTGGIGEQMGWLKSEIEAAEQADTDGEPEDSDTDGQPTLGAFES